MAETKTPEVPAVVRPEDVLAYEGTTISVKNIEMLRKLYGTQVTPYATATASDEEMLVFVHMIQHYKLDPAIRDVMLVPRRKNISASGQQKKYVTTFGVVVGYNVPKARALQSGLADGEEIDFYVPDGDNREWGRIKVWRKDSSRPYVYQVPVLELMTDSPFYAEAEIRKGQNGSSYLGGGKLHHQLRKTLTFRGYQAAFPELFRGWQSEADFHQDSALQEVEQRALPAVKTDAPDDSLGTPRSRKPRKVEPTPAEPPVEAAKPAEQPPAPEVEAKPEPQGGLEAPSEE